MRQWSAGFSDAMSNQRWCSCQRNGFFLLLMNCYKTDTDWTHSDCIEKRWPEVTYLPSLEKCREALPMAIGYMSPEAVQRALDAAKDSKEQDASARLSTEAAIGGLVPASNGTGADRYLPLVEISGGSSGSQRGSTERSTGSEAELVHPPEDFTGRPESALFNKIGGFENFKPLNAEQLQNSIDLVERDLKFFKTSDGKNVLEKVYATLSSHDSKLVLKMMAEVRENYARQTKDGVITPEQKGSWLHSIGEIAEVIDVAKLHGLNERQTRNAMIAAMFSDSVKSGWSQSTGGNFFSHHLDGARAADIVLNRHNGHNGFLDSWEGDNFDERDKQEIRHSILEHQIGPPRFMAQVYGKEICDRINSQRQAELNALSMRKSSTTDPLSQSESIRLGQLEQLSRTYDQRVKILEDLLLKQKSATELPTMEREQLIQRYETLQRHGRFVSLGESFEIKEIESAIGNPLNSELENDPRGGKRLAFQPSQRELLRRYVGEGAQYWHVPHADTPWAKVSQTVRTADALDNYFGQVDASGKPSKGPFKIAALRGPVSGFGDRDIFETIDSIQASEDSAKELMNSDERAFAERRSKQTELVYREALQSTEQFIRQRLNLSASQELPSVPFWNEKLNPPPATATSQERAEFAAKPEVKLAVEIHQHFTGELLRVRQVDHSASVPQIEGVSSPPQRGSRESKSAAEVRDAESVQGKQFDTDTRRRDKLTGGAEANTAETKGVSSKDRVVQPSEKTAVGTSNSELTRLNSRVTQPIESFHNAIPSSTTRTSQPPSGPGRAPATEVGSASKPGRSFRAGVGLGVGLGVTLGAGLQWLGSGNRAPVLKDQAPVVEKRK